MNVNAGLVISDKTTPASAATALIGYCEKPAAYAAAIINRGKEYVTAVCSAINVQTEQNPEQRRNLYKILHQAATRAEAAFSIASRKASGLTVTDAPSKPEAGKGEETDATKGKGAASAPSLRVQLDAARARIVELEKENATLVAANAELLLKLETRKATPRKPSARPAAAVQLAA